MALHFRESKYNSIGKDRKKQTQGQIMGVFVKFSSQDEVIKFGRESVQCSGCVKCRHNGHDLEYTNVRPVRRREIVGHPANGRGIHLGDDLAKVSTLKIPRWTEGTIKVRNFP